MRDKQTEFQALLREAFLLAKNAHDCTRDDTVTKLPEDKVSALSYAAACTSKYSAAEAIYWCSPELEDDDIPQILAQFDTFTDEIRNDYRTDHSRQWVDIEFEKLRELFEASSYKLDIC